MRKIRKIRKHVWAVIMVICFLGSFIGQSQRVLAADYGTVADDFKFDLFRADLYAQEDSPTNKMIHWRVESGLLTQEITDALDADKGFQRAVDWWEMANWVQKPTDALVGKYLDERSYYEVIIFSVLKVRTEQETFLDKMDKHIRESIVKITSDVKNVLKTKYSMEYSDALLCKKFDNAIKDSIKDWIKSGFAEDHIFLDTIPDAMSKIDDILSVSETIQEALKNICSFVCLSEIPQEMKALVNDWYERCPQKEEVMKEALKEVYIACRDICGASEIAFANAYQMGIREAASLFLDDMWETAMAEANPYVAAFFVGVKVGTDISNVLFSTNKTIEQYEKMVALQKFNTLLKESFYKFEQTYRESATEEYARNYFAAIEVMYTTYSLSCDFMIEYADVLYKDAMIGWVSSHKEDYNEFVNKVTEIKGLNQENYGVLFQTYLSHLQYTYPEVYRSVYGEEVNPDLIPVTDIKFLKDRLEWGMGDAFYSLDEPIISPANATNREVKYTSSDESVIWIDPYRRVVKVKKEGTAVITATTVDGGFSDSVTITVVNEKGGDGYSEGGDIAEPEENYEIGESFYVNNLCFKIITDQQIAVIPGASRDEALLKECLNIPKTVKYKGRFWKVIEVLNNGYLGGDNKNKEICVQIVNMPEGIQKIEDWAFSCFKVKKMYIPASVTDCGLFLGCCDLQEIEIAYRNMKYKSSDGIVYTKGMEQLVTCPMAKNNIFIPESVKDIVFLSLEHASLENIYVDEKNKTYVSRDGALYKKENDILEFCPSEKKRLEIDGDKVKFSINVFFECKKLEQITVSDRVSDILNSQNSGLSSTPWYQNYPDGVMYLGNFVYGYHGEMQDKTQIVLKEGTKGILTEAFAYSRNALVDIAFPESLQSIGVYAFEHCTGLKEIKIPKNVKSIERSAFWGCSNVERIYYNAEDAEAYLYTGRDNVEDFSIEVVLETAVKKIRGTFPECREMIYNCDSCEYINEKCFPLLTKVTFGDGVRCIPENSFNGCKNLEILENEEVIEYVGEGAFEDTKWIQNQPELVYVGKALYSCDDVVENVEIREGTVSITKHAFGFCIEEVKMPDTVKSIGDEAFYNCKYLNSVSLSRGLKEIGKRAFQYTRLHTIKLPQGLEVIGEYAFADVMYPLFEEDAPYCVIVPDSVKFIGEKVMGDIKDAGWGNMIVVKGSYAEEYAKTKGYPCYYVDEEYPYLATNEDGTYLFGLIAETETLVYPQRIKSMRPLVYIENYSWTCQAVPNEARISTEAIRKIEVYSNCLFGVHGGWELYNVEEIYFGEDVDEFIEGAFTAIGNLKKITVSEDNEKLFVLDDSLYSNERLIISWTQKEKYTVKETTETIVDGAFYNCKELRELTCPHTLRNMQGEELFYNQWELHEESDYPIRIRGFSDTAAESFCREYGHGGDRFQFEELVDEQNVTDILELQSDHPYRDSMDKTWIFTEPGAENLEITFAKETCVEDGYDYIMIYDSYNNVEGTFTGCELSEKTIKVLGDTVKIRLVSDEEGNEYGFSVVSVKSAQKNRLEDCKIILEKEVYIYSGQECKPQVVIVDNTGKQLVSGEDYIVYYDNNLDVGNASIIINGVGSYVGVVVKSFVIKSADTEEEQHANETPVLFEKGTRKTVSGTIYTNLGEGKVAYLSQVDVNKTSYTVLPHVKIDGKTYEVTKIAANAFKNCKKLKKVTIGSNITEIGKQAFYGCKNLKSITVKSKVLKKVGSKAFKGIHTKAKIKVPKTKLKDYKKRLKGKGQGKKVKIVK